MTTLKELTPEQEHQRQQFVDNLILTLLNVSNRGALVEDMIDVVKLMVQGRDEILQLTTGEQA